MSMHGCGCWSFAPDSAGGRKQIAGVAARPPAMPAHTAGAPPEHRLSTAADCPTRTGEVTIEVPRARHGTFEPQLIGKHERRFTGFDDKIVAMYARGMSVREIQ